MSKKIDLLYFDGSGFNLNPNQPYGWLPKGQNITLPALRGKGWTVLAALNTASEKIIEAQAYEGAANSKCIILFFDTLVKTIKKKTVVILDNASIHKSKAVKSKEIEWRKKGLFFQFIPAYCPELNKIAALIHVVDSFQFFLFCVNLYCQNCVIILSSFCNAIQFYTL